MKTLFVFIVILLIVGCGKKHPKAAMSYTTKNNMRTIESCIRIYHDDIGKWPKNSNDISDYTKTFGNGGDEWNKTKSLFHDAWGNPLILDFSADNIQIISCGKDGKEGGDEDIIITIKTAQQVNSQDSVPSP